MSITRATEQLYCTSPESEVERLSQVVGTATDGVLAISEAGSTGLAMRVIARRSFFSGRKSPAHARHGEATTIVMDEPIGFSSACTSRRRYNRM